MRFPRFLLVAQVLLRVTLRSRLAAELGTLDRL